MKQVFANPTPFISACVEAAQTYNLSGFNIDWEPTTEASEADATAYAAFLEKLTTELHRHSLEVSVDTGSWSVLWNYTKLSATNVDHIMTMATYTNNATRWLAEFTKAVRTGIYIFC